MAVALDPISELHRQLEVAATDPELDAADRAVKLRGLRARIADLLAIADGFLGDAAKLREAEASESARARLRARDVADLREELLDAGVPAEALDEAGIVGHGYLDELEEERLLEVVAPVIRGALDRAKFDTKLHPHGFHGRFEQTPDKPKPGKEEPGGKQDAQGHQIDPRWRDYFDLTDHPDAILAHMDRLKPTRDDTPEHIAKARKNLNTAKAGLMKKRKPLDVVENGDGTLSILDGNSTYAALAQEGLTHLPVKIKHDVGSAEDEAIKRVSDELATRAEAAEKDITPGLKHTVAENGGMLAELEHRLKSRASIESKIRRKQEKYPGMPANKAGDKVLDTVRYTAVYPSDDYVAGVQKVTDAMHAKGYSLYEAKNYWGGSDDYDGYHAVFRSPQGVAVELQFHTPESMQARTKLHPLFESFRESKDSHERYDLWQKMVKLTSQTPQPAGVEQLGPSKPSPSSETRHRRHEDTTTGAQS